MGAMQCIAEAHEQSLEYGHELQITPKISPLERWVLLEYFRVTTGQNCICQVAMARYFRIGCQQLTTTANRSSGVLFRVQILLFHSNTMSQSNEPSSDDSSAVVVHAVAAKGFNSDSGLYENSRPTYPAAAVAHLQTQLGLVPSESHVVDLGAGSGKFTRLLLQQKYHLLAVEPSPSMRKVFAEVLPTVPIQEGTGTSIPVEDGSQDAVVVAQAFHWFANIEVLREIHRVLKPDGKLGLIWNLEDRNSAKWVASLRDLYEKYEMDTPQYRLGLWKQVWETQEAKELFTGLQEAHFHHTQLCSDEMVWGRVASKSYVACRSPEEKGILREQVLSALGSATDLERDPAFGLVKYPYQTDVHWCAKLVN